MTTPDIHWKFDNEYTQEVFSKVLVGGPDSRLRYSSNQYGHVGLVAPFKVVDGKWEYRKEPVLEMVVLSAETYREMMEAASKAGVLSTDPLSKMVFIQTGFGDEDD